MRPTVAPTDERSPGELLMNWDCIRYIKSSKHFLRPSVIMKPASLPILHFPTYILLRPINTASTCIKHFLLCSNTSTAETFTIRMIIQCLADIGIYHYTCILSYQRGIGGRYRYRLRPYYRLGCKNLPYGGKILLFIRLGTHQRHLV